MCGIVGLFAKKPLEREDFTTFLEAWKLMEARGRDASGVAIYFNNNKILLSKFHSVASEHANIISKLNIPYKKITTALAHARAATTGTPMNNENNHPLYQYIDGKLITLVHNGYISFPQKHIRDVDSDKLFYKIRENKKFDDKTIAETLEHATGSIAVIYTDGEIMYFYHDINPLEYVETRRYILLASDSLDELNINAEVNIVEPDTLFKIENRKIIKVKEYEKYYYKWYNYIMYK